MKADIRIFKDSQALSEGAAKMFVKRAGEAIEARGRFLVALSGGGTPFALYHLLRTTPYQDQIEWDKTLAFWGDERCVPPDDAGSNYRQAMDTLLSHVPIADENIQRIKGELEPAEASRDYARILKDYAPPGLDWPRFDLVLLGMGEDGHTASLFPGSRADATSPTQAVTANYQGRPANRVTLTSLVFNSARQIMFLVAGESKAAMLARVINGENHPEELPAQRIRPTDGDVVWLVDQAAASKLNVRNSS